MDGDRLYIDLPDELALSDKISCSGITDAPVGVLEASCSGVDKSLWISLDTIDQETGKFEFIVDGITNAPSFRQTGTFKNVYMQTADYYNI